MKEQRINLSELSNLFNAWQTCNAEWKEKHEERINELMGYLPHGSGIDHGVVFDWKTSKTLRLVFSFGFHHMVEGSYDGWTEHKLIITPDFISGFNLRITGRDRDMIKDYLYQVFNEVFYTDINYKLKKES